MIMLRFRRIFILTICISQFFLSCGKDPSIANIREGVYNGLRHTHGSWFHYNWQYADTFYSSRITVTPVGNDSIKFTFGEFAGICGSSLCFWDTTSGYLAAPINDNDVYTFTAGGISGTGTATLKFSHDSLIENSFGSWFEGGVLYNDFAGSK